MRSRECSPAWVCSASVNAYLPERLEKLRQWNDQAVPSGLRQRILREFARWQMVNRQIRDLEQERAKKIRDDGTPHVEQVRRLLRLKGIGENGAWLLVEEFFAWRQIKNRRELGSLAGLAPTPYASGESRREQGISKAGNRRVRWMMVQLAWCWLRYQPKSALSRWYVKRFGLGNGRQRKIGIVALARKLLVALWQYLETGEPPEGAELRARVGQEGRLDECGHEAGIVNRRSGPLAMHPPLTYSRSMRFVETPVFTRDLAEILDDEGFRSLQLALLQRPELGPMIRGSGGLRKLRWAGQGRGKRGGLRVIYYWDRASETFYMLYIYPKNEQEDLTAEQIRVLGRLVREEFG